MRALSRIGIIFVAVLFLAGLSACTDTPADIVKKNRDQLSRTLDTLAHIGTKASNDAPGPDKVQLPAGGPVLDANEVGSFGYEGTANAQLFTVQELQDPDGQSRSFQLFPARFVMQTIRAMVTTGRFPENKQEAFQAIKRFQGWRYAVVVKTRSARAPQTASTPVSTNVTDRTVYASGTFQGGMIEADALVYDLDDGSFLGGFSFKAESSGNVETTAYGGDKGDDRLQQALDRDLGEQVKKSVLYGLVDRLPADRIYLNGNLRQQMTTERGARTP